jgi:hypothetical protein
MQKNNDFIYLKDTKLRYIGYTNEAFIQDKLYTGNFLIFPQTTVCFILRGPHINRATYQTLTKNWETLDGREITEMGRYQEY